MRGGGKKGGTHGAIKKKKTEAAAEKSLLEGAKKKRAKDTLEKGSHCKKGDQGETHGLPPSGGQGIGKLGVGKYVSAADKEKGTDRG